MHAYILLQIEPIIVLITIINIFVLAIGLLCILTISTKPLKTKQRGVSESLFVLTKHNGVRFEFIFTYLVPGSPRMFQSTMAVHK